MHSEALAVAPEPALAVQAGGGLHRPASAAATAAAGAIAVVAPEPAEVAHDLATRTIDRRVAGDPTPADDPQEEGSPVAAPAGPRETPLIHKFLVPPLRHLGPWRPRGFDFALVAIRTSGGRAGGSET